MTHYFSLIDTTLLDAKIKSGGFPFSQQLFWDADIDQVDLKAHRRYVIERVVTRGFLEDLYLMVNLYSTDEIREALRKSRELDPKTVNFCSHYFQLPKSEMNVSSFYH